MAGGEFRVIGTAGLDFFANLPDELENRIERSASFTEWNRK